MLRTPACLFACVAMLLIAAPAPAPAEPVPSSAVETPKAKLAARAKAKRRVSRSSKDFGFLPGYEPPPQRPLYGSSSAYKDGPRFWYRGRYYYGWGGPGYYRGRWNGGSFGPCWTQTPIGPIWNCGS